MAYTKQSWSDSPSTATPISAARLGHVEDGVEAAASVADTANSAAAAAQSTANSASTAAANAQSTANSAATAAANAQSTANGAQTLADGKAKAYYQTTAPSGGTYHAGDLWFDTDDGYKIYTWTGSAWASSFATLEGATATALTSANGKNRSYYQSTQPTGGTYADGDLWFDTSNGNRISRYNGSSWVVTPLGNLAVTGLDAGAITTGSLNASRLATTTLDASNMTTGTLVAGVIGTNTLKAKNYYSDSDGSSRLVIGPSFKFSGSDPAVFWDLNGDGSYSTSEPRLFANSSQIQVTMGTNKSYLDVTPTAATLLGYGTGANSSTLTLSGSLAELSGPGSTCHVDISSTTITNNGPTTVTGALWGNSSLGAENLKTVQSGAINVGTSSSGLLKQANGSSSVRYKVDIEDLAEIDPTALYDLPIRQFRFKPGYLIDGDYREHQLVPGVIAEEMAEHFPVAVDYDEDMQIETWDLRIVLSSALKLIQDQHARITALEQAVASLQAQMAAL